jgi:hypothetical protein
MERQRVARTILGYGQTAASSFCGKRFGVCRTGVVGAKLGSAVLAGGTTLLLVALKMRAMKKGSHKKAATRRIKERLFGVY